MTAGRDIAVISANVAGAFAFVWPFAAPAFLDGDRVAALGSGWILVILLACVGYLLFLDLGRGALGPKTVALIGVLGAAMVALRLPGFIAGFSAMFIVVLVAGNAFGPAFGFTLGAVGTFASGIFVGGLGPWLPFQMVAVAWVGLGAGFLPRGGRWPVRIASLAVYGFVVGFAFGAVMNLWSWPYIAGSSSVGWDPQAGAAANLRHYATYYMATSFAWDAFRAVGNAALVVVLGRPLLKTLDRAARRMSLEIGPVVKEGA
ncbi:MAG: ECF transporter S component [Actinobacteria bacterium]|nr:ECF transporter S component [Actinomycetota bacterium]